MKEPIITDENLIKGSEYAFNDGCDRCANLLRLTLLELLAKAGAGHRSSHTEEIFLSYFGLMKRDRTPNKKGREFIVSMVYAPSNMKSLSCILANEHRL